jgi:hypothetical protein
LLFLLAAVVGVKLCLQALSSYRVLATPNDWMAPHISEGALVVLEPVPVDALAIGDVIAYRHPSQPNSAVLLRVVAEPPAPSFIVGGRLLRMHGDNARAPLEAWDAEFQGMALRMILTIPGLGTIAQLGIVPPALFATLV